MMIYGRAVGGSQSTSNPHFARRVLKFFGKYNDALAACPNMGADLIVNISKPCRLCGGKYKDDKHLLDGVVYDLSSPVNHGGKHWFID